MTQNILKTAVIGLGRIAWSDHLPALLRHPEKFQVTAVVDPISDRCRDTCAKFHVPAGIRRRTLSLWLPRQSTMRSTQSKPWNTAVMFSATNPWR